MLSPDFLLLQADARRIPLADGSVHCVVTSPPYWGLRDYGVEGQIGLETTPHDYVERLVEVFREVRRVLRPEGTLWLNLGDSYASGMRSAYDDDRHKYRTARAHDKRPPTPTGVKPKDLIGIPWLVAFALRDDGWYLRCDIIWAKPNPMPESVTDRPTKAHEYIFLLTKRQTYFYDAEAVSEVGAGRELFGNWCRGKASTNSDRRDGGRQNMEPTQNRNRRSVWHIPTQAFPEAHFATYPEALVEPCILAGTSAKGCCPKCGKGWERVVDKPKAPDALRNRGNGSKMDFHSWQTGSGQKLQDWYDAHPPKTTGWRPACNCNAGDPVPAVVFDPFNGSGTTGVVAVRHGRRYVGMDLSREYLRMAQARIGKAARPNTYRDLRRDEDAPLFANTGDAV